MSLTPFRKTKLDDWLTRKENTLIIFTSDNGELHVPEGPHARVTHNTPFRVGKRYLYEGGLRIPLIVRWPTHVPSNRVVDDPVMNTDWIATLLDLVAIPSRSPRFLEGKECHRIKSGRSSGTSLTTTIRGTSCRSRPPRKLEVRRVLRCSGSN